MNEKELHDEYSTYVDVLNNIKTKDDPGIKWGLVLASDIWDYFYSSKKFLFTIRWMIKVLLYKRFKLVCNFDTSKKNKILFFQIDLGWERFDEMYLKVKKCVKNYDEINMLIGQRLVNKNLRIINLKITNLKKILDVIKVYKKFEKIDRRLLRLFLAVRMVGYKDFINEFKDSYFNYNLIVTFHDHTQEQHLIAQMYKARGIKTVTLQHGYYGYSTRFSGGCVAFDCFVSDFILAWGEHSRKTFQAMSIDDKRIIEVGSPKHIDFEFPNIPDRVNWEKNKPFGLVLTFGSDSINESNILLIQYANKIAKKAGYKYIIRPHPIDPNPDVLLKYVDNDYFGGFSNERNIDEYAEKVDFTLVFISSVYYELIVLLKPVFVYADDDNEEFPNEIVKELSFKNIDQLIKLVNIDKRDIVLTLYKYRKLYFETENVSDNYREFFSQYL